MNNRRGVKKSDPIEIPGREEVVEASSGSDHFSFYVGSPPKNSPIFFPPSYLRASQSRSFVKHSDPINIPNNSASDSEADSEDLERAPLPIYVGSPSSVGSSFFKAMLSGDNDNDKKDFHHLLTRNEFEKRRKMVEECLYKKPSERVTASVAKAEEENASNLSRPSIVVM